MQLPPRDRFGRYPQSELGEGLYFSVGDYAGLLRRLVIVVLDCATLLGSYFAFGTLLLAFSLVNPAQLLALFWISVWLYLAVLKPSIGTVGYWVTGCRILTLRGTRPSVPRMTFRLLLCLLSPFTPILDLLWASIDDQRQTLRDRFAGTCVVRRRAAPQGWGEVHLSHYHALGYNLMYATVRRPT